MIVLWTETDRAAWRRLVSEAQACATKPSRPTTALLRAAKAAGKAVPPTADDLGRGHCILLWKFAKGFCCLDAAGRAENAAALAEHARLAGGWVDPPARGPDPGDAADALAYGLAAARPLRPRADIDG